jgi:hypothetical protein
MSRGLMLLAAGLLLCGAARAEDSDAGARGPLIRVEPAGFDFGAVVPGKLLRKEFRLRNAGDRPLVLQRVRTSCGCTVGKLARTTLEPGAATSLVVSLATGSSRGHIVKSVVVPSNDTKTPLLEIKIEATVEEPPAK